MSEADRERYREARAAGIAQHGNNVMLDTPFPASPLLSRPSCACGQAAQAFHLTEPLAIMQVALLQPKRAASDIVVPGNSYLRVHAQPKRFPAAYSVDWKVSYPVRQQFSLPFDTCEHSGMSA